METFTPKANGDRNQHVILIFLDFENTKRHGHGLYVERKAAEIWNPRNGCQYLINSANVMSQITVGWKGATTQ